MPPQETGKQRAVRIPLDYYKHWSPLERAKLGLTALAVLLCLGWLGVSFAFPTKMNRAYSHGPIASVHAAWENKCESCHQPFSPINGNTWIAPFFGTTARSSEERCKICHAAPDHHARQKSESVQNCGSCHRDHQGRDALLTRTADTECLRCHKDLNSHQDGELKYENVTDFMTNHPEFALLRREGDRSFKPKSRTLKFSHQQHMMPGQVLAEDSARPWTLGMIADKKERARYAQQMGSENEKALIQLKCSSCHQLDSGDFMSEGDQLATLPKGAVLTPRAAGDYFRPIVFENHCKACHPLNKFDSKMPELTAEHRRQPKEMKLFLDTMYTRLYLLGELKAEMKDKPRVRLDPVQDLEALKPGNEEIGMRVTNALMGLYGGSKTCLKCHDFFDDPGKIAPKSIKAPEPHVVWFEHAKFNHVSHRAVDCRQCHAACDPGPAKFSDNVVEKEPLALPGIDNCKKCHSPERTENGVNLGGVRHDCTECHRYHHGDEPMQGLGAGKRDPDPLRKDDKLKMSIERFLSGDPQEADKK